MKLNPCHVFLQQEVNHKLATFKRVISLCGVSSKCLLCWASGRLFARRGERKYSFPCVCVWSWTSVQTLFLEAFYVCVLLLNGCVMPAVRWMVLVWSHVALAERRPWVFCTGVGFCTSSVSLAESVACVNLFLDDLWEHLGIFLQEDVMINVTALEGIVVH